MDKTNILESFTDHLQWYDSLLKSVSDSASMLYIYSNVIHGYSARLTAKEAEALEEQPGILSVIPKLASDVIVGVLDSGVWPELKSFNDEGLGPVPEKWKGECEVGKTFKSSSCNKKLIGARYFSKGYEGAVKPINETVESKSPRDDYGHGTHTSTMAAGLAVSDASLFGFASRTARGMATKARVAIYKVCWLIDCFGSDILAAMDKAVQDDVDIMSLSLGGQVSKYYKDIIAIGAFSAMTHGILLSCLDGNGDGKTYSGVSLYNGKTISNSMVPIVYAANVSSSNNSLCFPRTLSPAKVVGKIVGKKLEMLSRNTSLLRLIRQPQLASEARSWGVQPSSVVAAFSSRSPNPITLEIPKPDIIAPGVSILAGWTGAAAPTGLDEDKRRVNFNIISSTSMSCPHVSGIAALLKVAHSDWSPAAIRSTLMTIAYSACKNGKTIQDVSTRQPTTLFDYGAGHVDPIEALDPGLVYDTTVDDYLDFLCALGYSSTHIKRVTNRHFTRDSSKNYSLADFNYPSISVPLQSASGKKGGANVTSALKYSRTLTNVGSPGTYKVSMVSPPKTVKISVEPASLCFSRLKEKKSYTVTFTTSSMPSRTARFASLAWSDGKHTVTSPIAFTWT
ncbi:hypothetical protein SLEP1_g16643 [Rubroshorea leprosula]|uniref:Uncharacterized protein n=1 Tax=Rubroshorea leprosula TaxID=152421 RepID=A0AAV5IZ33_9ROSI|nr:hypothetical protein SLEP1_g16643 [Rubroshorea leprosula]